MKKDRLYFYTLLSISLIFLLIASFAVQYFIKASANQLIEVQVESSKREANEIAKLIAHQFNAGLPKDVVVNNVQKTIMNTNSNTWFISVIDWSGKEVCHPDKTRIGQITTSNQTLIESLKEKNNSDNLYELLVESNSMSQENSSEIIHTVAISTSDLIVAANVNTGNVANQMNVLKTNFYLIFLIMGILVIIFSFLAVRIIGSRYEKELELKNSTLTSEVLNLSKLNTDLVSYKEKVAEETVEVEEETPQEVQKSRILTYVRNELVPTSIENIDFAYTENTITYIVNKNNKKSTTNLSLDELYSNLPPKLFFRANRQYIIGISAIDKILKYGNSQLKIVMQTTDVEIIISKNKAAEFKQWLNS